MAMDTMAGTTAACWEHFDHGADIGVRGYGRSKAEAFEQAAMALTGVIAPPETVAQRYRLTLLCEGQNDEVLLVAWLNALVTQMALRHMLFSRFNVVIDGNRLHAHIAGEPLSVARHHPAVEVKGATFTALRVARGEDGQWLAQAVVDV